ncbi:hypothetical protein F441_22979 [Phytophthora nicotianae CJ01A1]|uniref:Uncharacterized protein n=1 Tax=Phytophthora nicotianae CJ01A1 TaxID=1317063 RepID=W2VN49_PHYNI|nr:hypothetical protein F441_22979 [Phytophthora nicotianae CJ01A1]
MARGAGEDVADAPEAGQEATEAGQKGPRKRIKVNEALGSVESEGDEGSGVLRPITAGNDAKAGGDDQTTGGGASGTAGVTAARGRRHLVSKWCLWSLETTMRAVILWMWTRQPCGIRPGTPGSSTSYSTARERGRFYLLRRPCLGLSD